MADNKNNHYVPQFYLRNFSTDSERKTVHLYNIKRAIPILNVGISGQCYRHYLYGNDGRLERGLGSLETAISPVFSDLITTGTVPARGTKQHGLIAQFISVQNGRTVSKESEINQTIDLFAKYQLQQTEPELAATLDDLQIGLKNAAILNVQQTAIMAPLLFDLHYKLLHPPTDSHFVTSDNPILLLNQFLDRSHMRFTRGFACRGLQIYCPISPQYSLFLYDSDLYKVGPVGRHCVEIAAPDVTQLNILQYLYAQENLYFSSEKESAKIRVIANRYHNLRPSGIGRLVVVKKDTERELVTMNANRPKFFPELTFVKLKRRAGKSRTPGVRNQIWTTIVRDFAAAVDRGEANDFATFVMSHRLSTLVKPFWRGS